jgi:hypothetical protein
MCQVSRSVKKDGRSFPLASPSTTTAVVQEIIDSLFWILTQIQLNLLDDIYQAGLEGLHYRLTADVMVVIMEPLRAARWRHVIPYVPRCLKSSRNKATPCLMGFPRLADFKKSVSFSAVAVQWTAAGQSAHFADAAPGCMKTGKRLFSHQALYAAKIRSTAHAAIIACPPLR